MEFVKSLNFIQIILAVIVFICLAYAIIQVLKVLFKFIIEVALPILAIVTIGGIVISLIFIVFGNRATATSSPNLSSVEAGSPNPIPALPTTFNQIQYIEVTAVLSLLICGGIIVLLLIAFSIKPGRSSATEYPSENKSSESVGTDIIVIRLGTDGKIRYVGDDAAGYNGDILWSVGGERVGYSSDGKTIMYIGSEKVYTNSNGDITWIGDKKVGYDPSSWW